MSNFANSYLKYVNHLEEINDTAKKNPERMVHEVESSYRDQLCIVADKIARSKNEYRIVMLSGPSSSGKTTTAHQLSDYLQERGVDTCLISLDNFYRGEKDAPLLKNGHHDYESVDALNLPILEECLMNLMSDSVCEMPLFDFSVRRPSDRTKHIELKEHGVAIVEGIHALNPAITYHLPKNRVFKTYVSVKQGIKDKNGMLLSAVDVRFLRRLVRDNSFRSTMPERTLNMWPNVLEGENKYIRPYKIGSDMTINSIHIYEPCVIRTKAIPLLQKIIEAGLPEADEMCRLICALESFEPLPESIVPVESIMREFIGGGLYME